MKRLLVLVVLMILTVSATGCRNCSWFRGTFLNPGPEQLLCDPCAPMVSAQPGACAPCGSAPAGTPLMPGPGAYVPGAN